VKLEYYHRYNALTFRILDAAVFTFHNKAFTTIEMGEALGIPYERISSAISHHRHRKTGFFRKMPKKEEDNEGKKQRIRWKITEKGIEAYVEFLHRIKKGFDLNRKRPYPKKMSTYGQFPYVKLDLRKGNMLLPEQFAPYYGITRYGSEKCGLTEDWILQTMKENAENIE
jgi:hypothetical protein